MMNYWLLEREKKSREINKIILRVLLRTWYKFSDKENAILDPNKKIRSNEIVDSGKNITHFSCTEKMGSSRKCSVK